MSVNFCSKKIENNFHLTLSILIVHQDTNVLKNILKIQKKLTKDIKISDKILKNVIYKYKKDTIHFSVVDFLLAEPFKKINSDRKKFEVKHKKLVEKISKKVDKFKQLIQNPTIELKCLYPDNTFKKLSNSIAIQAYLSKDILQFIRCLVKNIKIIHGYPKVKGYPKNDPEYFPINIIRFFKKPTQKEGNLLSKRIENINKIFKLKPIHSQLKSLNLVISNDYLSNPNPEIVQFEI